MDIAIAKSALKLAGPVVSATPVSPALQPEWSVRRPFLLPIRLPVIPEGLPMASTKNGSLYNDRNDANLHWYLPDFALAPDVDLSFAFSARQESQQENGTPFNVARLTFSIIKSIPADATQFAQANPGAKLREIPLENIAAVLNSPYTDNSGQPQARNFSATSVTDAGNGLFQVLFDGTILGDAVVGLYQDLRVIGKSSVALSATFRAWSSTGALAPPYGLRVQSLFVDLARQAALSDIIAVHPVDTRFNPADPPESPARPQLAKVSLPFTKALDLGLKYNDNGYQLQYTLAALGSPSRVILSVADLSGFTGAQSQYTELKKLGIINTKYPSISRAYIGVFSRAIVLIPQRYSILRSQAGCEATCFARVDSSSASQCAFEFTFVIAPEVNRVELREFQNEVQGIAELNGYEITFASLLSDTPASSLQTTFKSTAQFAAGSDPHTFSLTVSVQDDGPMAPALTIANLFIQSLCLQTGTDLIGSLSLKLDDGFTDPVLATIDLNFEHTAGSDELAVDLDPTEPAINFSNLSPLDLLVQEYALLQDSTLTINNDSFLLPAMNKRALPLPVPGGISVVAAAQLALPSPLTSVDTPKYLNFLTVDVQQMQYLIALDASGVDFKKVASLVASVTFPSQPAFVPLTFTLSSNLVAASQYVLIPLVSALFSLPGTVQLTVTFVDPSVNTVAFSLTNDFVSEPELTIVQSEIVAQQHAAG